MRQVESIQMKTIFKSMTSEKKARQKQAEFERKTGVKWDRYSTGMGMVFTPVITKDTPLDNDAAQTLVDKLPCRDYISFVKIAELTELELSVILSGAKTLVMQRKAISSVNRMGNFSGIKITGTGVGNFIS